MFEKSYNKFVDAYTDEDFFGKGWKVAWWRELFHLLGGIVLGVGPAIYGIYLPYTLAAVALLIAIKEISDGVGSVKKKILDIAFWVLGAALIGAIL